MKGRLTGLLLIAMASTSVQASVNESSESTVIDSAKNIFDEHIKISGFGSIAASQSNNDAGYMGNESDSWELDQDTLLGIQLEAKFTERLKFVTQVVTKGRYDYDIEAEMAYFSYETDLLTVRAGKFATPFFMYSDYLDVGYAYPMLRPSNELYDNIIISNYEGMDLLIPIEFENSSLLLQPYAGVTRLAERDAKGVGETTFNDFIGATVHWYIDDLTLRASYATGQSEYTARDRAEIPIEVVVDDQKGEFISVGAHYDNGDLLAMLEAAEIKLDGSFSDTISVSGLVGYRVGSIMPYVGASWLKTTDDELRVDSSPLSYQTNSYSIGTRWDFYKNVALKLDLVYAVFDDAPLYYGFEDDSFVYSAAIDFVF